MKHRINENSVLSIAGALVLWGALTLLFVFYYDLNDDVMIRDILSGIYTGTPDAHNNQMLYPISILIAGLYRITDRVPWFGLFEILCMMLSFVMMAYGILSIVKKLSSKIIYIILQMLLFSALMMWELVHIQYTVVAGMLAAAAGIYLYCGDEVGVSDKKATYAEMGCFIRKNIPAILLVTVAFNIRSELVLLLSPILAATAICKWSEERYRWDRYVICGYLGVFLSICLLMICSLVTDRAAYSSPEWKEYRRFFDARTDLYDFTGVPDYDKNVTFYEEEGITREQYGLLTDYNYYLDESIDADMLERIVKGVRDGRAVGRSTYGKTIREAVWEYIHNTADISIKPLITGYNIMSTNGAAVDNSEADLPADHIFSDEVNQHKPFNVIVLILYIALIASAYYKRDKAYLIKLPTLVILRSIPWLYVYLQGRVLSRITHPLYIIEISVLLAMLVRAWTGHITDILTAGLIAVICLAVIPARYRYISLSEEAREEINAEADRLYGYTSLNPDTYYYIDTYSTVEWTERVFGSEPVTKRNTQLLGGWMGNSPLDSYKKAMCDKEEILLKEDLLALTDTEY